MAEEVQREVERRVEERRLQWLAQAGAEEEAVPAILQLASQLAGILESQRDTQITMMHVLEGLQSQGCRETNVGRAPRRSPGYPGYGGT